MRSVSVLLLATFLLAHNILLAQDKLKIKYGKVTAADFVLPDSPFVKNADAVYVADIGSTDFNGNTHGGFSLTFRRHVRIKINNANGVKAADFAIPMFFEGENKEKVDNLKGVTYNLEDGKIVETELKNSIVFEDKLSKTVWLKKFSMPGVKAGSLVDVSYTISSDFTQNLQPWQFQGEYPRLWSEYEVGIPEFFNYVFLSQGYLPYAVKTSDERSETFSITFQGGSSSNQSATLPGRVFTNRWVVKNAPAMKEEPFTTTLENHVTKIEFQLNMVQFTGQMAHYYMNNWPKVVEKRNESEYLVPIFTKPTTG